MESLNMKKCKSCRKEIEAEASKCPYCQGYQKWYKNPQYYNLIFLLPFSVFLFWNTGLLNKKEFEAYKADFSINKENVVVIKNTQTRLITYRIKNNTAYKWNHINYEVVGSKHDEVIAVSTGSDYSWVVQPNSDSLLTVKIKLMPGATSWSFKIKDLRSARF